MLPPNLWLGHHREPVIFSIPISSGYSTCSPSRLNPKLLKFIPKNPREALTTLPHQFGDSLTRAYLYVVNAIAEPISASRAHQLLARVRISTVQPNTAEMYSMETFIYNAPLLVPPVDLNGARHHGAIPAKYGIPTLGAVVRFSQSWDTLSINGVELSLTSSLLGQPGCTLIHTCLQYSSKACDRSARITVRRHRQLPANRATSSWTAWQVSMIGTAASEEHITHVG